MSEVTTTGWSYDSELGVLTMWIEWPDGERMERTYTLDDLIEGLEQRTPPVR